MGTDFTAEIAETAESREARRLNDITARIIGAAMRVHGELGPGLLESAYEACLLFELADRGLSVCRQQPLPVIYRGVRLDCGYRIDLVVDEAVIVEVKSTARLEAIHEAQVLSYLRLANLRVGLLMNFNVKALKYGLRRLVNGFPASPQRGAPPLHPVNGGLLEGDETTRQVK
jgi:GxxExxY protein